MQTYSEQELLLAIQSGIPFEGTLTDGSLHIKIQDWVPYLSTAIHAGHKMREDLVKSCALTKKERRQEEDPLTDQLIEYCPIILSGLDSRYAYDLNRAPDACIHEYAWNQKVWRAPLSHKLQEESRERHARFYRVLKALIEEIVKRTGGCMIFDLHSYNWQIRNHPNAPIFNLGTAYFPSEKWQPLLQFLQKQLSKITLPNLETTVECDVVFQGKGYQAQFVRENFSNVPLIPLEIKKIFMDERSGEAFPLVVDSLQVGLNNAILSTAAHFAQSLGNTQMRTSDLAPSSMESIVQKVDQEIYRLSSKFDTLHYVNPINYQQEKRAFFSRKGYTPSFRYRQLRVDPYLFREKLYALPISQIQDPVLRSLYRSIVDGYAAKTDLITSIGTPQFLYNSLRYYGEPSAKDIANAQFILHISDIPQIINEKHTIDAEKTKLAFETILKEHRIDFSVQLSNRLVAKAMVEPSRKTIQINQHVKLTETELNALLSHEFGIHVLTTENALLQPLRILELGLPGSTKTQEGLAILSEYLSGNLTIKRLKLLAMRVIAIKMMVKGESFSKVYQYLLDTYRLDKDEAFAMTTRTFRGGGFTKDYLYLSGFSAIAGLYQKRDLSALMIGKTSLPFLNALDNLIERGLLQKPLHLPQSLTQEKTTNNPILDFLIKNL